MTKKRPYAIDTAVPIARSRAEVERLLRDFGAEGWQWTDNVREGKITLQFMWHDEGSGSDYLARFTIYLPDEAVLREQAIDGRSGRVSPAKLDRLRQHGGRREHRALALWLKASLVAIAEGIVSPEDIFLPYLVTRSGRTVAEEARGKLGAVVDDVAGLLAGKVGS